MISGNDGPLTSSAPSDHTSSSIRATNRTPPGSNSSAVMMQGPNENSNLDDASARDLRSPFFRRASHAVQFPITEDLTKVKAVLALERLRPLLPTMLATPSSHSMEQV